ncbi:MAG: hypothetical protein ACUZ8I_09820, partial [Candidatus Scalindua sp.]
LAALIEETPTRRTVTLEYNEKDRQMMANLQRAIVKINRLGPTTLSGKTVEFRVGEITSHLKST